MILLISISDITTEFERLETNHGRRTVNGLAKGIGCSKQDVISVLESNPDIFEEIMGCKGKMFIRKLSLEN